MATEILRPNGVGSETNIEIQYPDSGYHWEKVDDVTPDDNSTYVEQSAVATNRDLYALPAHSGVGVINYVRAYMRIGVPAPMAGQCWESIKTHGTVYDVSGIVPPNPGWFNHYYQWDNNPFTDGAWTWDEIDALEVGVKLAISYEAYYLRCTQVYVEVDYTDPNVTIDAPAVAIDSQALAGSLGIDRIFSAPVVGISGEGLIPSLSISPAVLLPPTVAIDVIALIPSFPGKRFIIKVITAQNRSIKSIASQYRKVKLVTTGGR